LFLGLLIQGCGPKKRVTTADQTNTNQVSTNYVAPVVTQLPPVIVETPITSNTVASNIVAVTPPEAQKTDETVIPNQDTVAPAETKEYTIVKNDNFQKIAKAHGITVAALIKANPKVNPNKLKISQKIVIPAPELKVETKEETQKTTEGSASKTNVSGVTTYTVKSGDTLNKIAKAHGTTIKAIQAANGMKTTQLQVGKKLKIPAKSAASTVKAAKTTTAK
jgi:LysM repeat protein